MSQTGYWDSAYVKELPNDCDYDDDDDDNANVSETGGSKTFKSLDNNENNNFANTNVSEQTRIRDPQEKLMKQLYVLEMTHLKGYLHSNNNNHNHHKKKEDNDEVKSTDVDLAETPQVPPKKIQIKYKEKKWKVLNKDI